MMLPYPLAMASIDVDKKTGYFQVRFRLEGKQYKRSLATQDERTAKTARGRVEETLRLILDGRLEIPAGADVAEFVVSEGRRVGPIVPPADEPPPAPPTVGEVFDQYAASIPVGTKADSTIYTERIHLGNLRAELGETKPFPSIDHARLVRYVAARSKLVAGDTIKQEVGTFRQVWAWARKMGLPCCDEQPTKGLKYPRRPEKPPFKPFDQVAKLAARAGISNVEASALWESVFLSVEQIEKMLEVARKSASPQVAYPAMCFVAWTGARRSEMMRLRIDDVDFTAGQVLLREKKRVHSRSSSTRFIPIHSALRPVLEKWIKLRQKEDSTSESGDVIGLVFPMNRSKAARFFHAAITGSKWEKLPGWHTLRHSFASNLAARGVDQRIIDEWMGHQTEEQRKRYRHLFPGDQARSIEMLSRPAAK